MRKFFVMVLLTVAACAKAPDVTPVEVACPDLLAGCRIDREIEIRFSNIPTTMQAFGLEVTAPEGVDIHASFQMRGMDMGMNRYRLLRQNDKWRANVMLPACVQGRRDWLLRLEVGGKTYEVPFVAG